MLVTSTQAPNRPGVRLSSAAFNRTTPRLPPANLVIPSIAPPQ